MSRLRRAGGLLAAGLLLAGCAGADDTAPDAGPEAVATIASDLAPCPAAGAPASGGDPLPDLEFPCLGGDAPFVLGDAPGVPTVLTLWAPWCGPCREELPLFQQLFDRAGAVVSVVGLVERDTAASSVAYADEVGITFPSGLDGSGDLMTDQGLNALPATYFLAADGSVAFRKIGPIASYADLQALVREHLGVDVP